MESGKTRGAGAEWKSTRTVVVSSRGLSDTQVEMSGGRHTSQERVGGVNYEIPRKWN